MIEAFQTLTAITDPAANIAIMGGAWMLFKHHIRLKVTEMEIDFIKRELGK